MKINRLSRAGLLGVLGACVSVSMALPVSAQGDSSCGPSGYRVIATHWDAVLGMGWELRQSCAHPEWPAHSVPVASAAALNAIVGTEVKPAEVAQMKRPLLVHAGDSVRMWEQEENVRIELTGVAEETARSGDRIIVRVTRPSDGSGVRFERIAGTVRGPEDVEMEP